MEKISILIAEDHKLIRETWSFVITSSDFCKVIAECSSSDQAVALAGQLEPDIVLMDINIKPFNGFEATEKISSLSLKTKVIGLSMYSHPGYVQKMFKSGGKGYVTKNSSTEEMYEAIQEVHRGQIYVCSEVKNLQTKAPTDAASEIGGLGLLTARELQISKHIKEGRSSREIASILEISLKTVEVHRHNILRKLNIKNSSSLVNLINGSGDGFL
jgi:DNA-binding NarL/FixJ family response regulator